MQSNVVYGVMVFRPAMCARLVEMPVKPWDWIRGAIAAAWFWFTQCLLMALSATCFMFAAKTMGL
ncbi:MAG TPA: hypothetical protein VMV57_14890 [Terracidiphilus sp.]|nr:hypothetical protein [Terracidiphilus sp.]